MSARDSIYNLVNAARAQLLTHGFHNWSRLEKIVEEGAGGNRARLFWVGVVQAGSVAQCNSRRRQSPTSSTWSSCKDFGAGGASSTAASGAADLPAPVIDLQPEERPSPSLLALLAAAKWWIMQKIGGRKKERQYCRHELGICWGEDSRLIF